MADKELFHFDHCAVRCLHLSPQEEEWTSSFSGDSKMYTSGIIVNSQGSLTEVNITSGYCQSNLEK